MLNVYDIKIDSAGTNAFSNITGDVVFDTNNLGRIALQTKNVRESANRLYYTDARVHNQINLYASTAGFATPITLTGNVTGTGTGTIATTIANNAVTYAKIQNITANRILGRVTSLGIPQELAVSSGLTFSGASIQVQTNGITNTMLRAGLSTSVIGRASNSGGNVADIVASSDGQVLKRVGSTVGFHSIGLTDLPNSGVSAGTFNNVTVNTKGLVTTAINKDYTTNQTISITGDATGSGSSGITLTLATVNGNIGSFNYLTVNGKGLVTSASNRDYTTNQTVTLSGDVGGSGSSGISTTIGTNVVSNAKFRQSVGVSVVGRSVNSTGNIADISASSDGQVLKRVGSTVGFHSIGTNDINNSVITYNKIQNISANRILGRVTSTGAIQELALSSGLAFSGASIMAVGGGSGNIMLSGDVTGSGSTGIVTTIAPNAVTYAKIQNVAGNKILGNVGVAGAVEELALTSGLALSGKTIGITTNGVTNTMLRQSSGVSVVGRSVNSTGNVSDIIASSDGQVLKRVGGVVGFNSIGMTDLPLSGVSAGTFNNVTVNTRGIITSALLKDYTTNQTITLSGDATGSGSSGITLTLATVNSNIGTFNNVTVNGKGLITSASNSDYITNQTVTLSGDVTGSGSSGIATTIANSAVTYSKIQNVSQNRILGNVGVTGIIEELALTSGLAFSGRTLFVDYTNSPYKNICRATTTAALTVNYANGASGVGATLTATTNVVLPTQDGVSLAVGDRLLVKNQASTLQNGIYIVTSLGSAGVSPWVLTRATDSDTASKIYQATITVKEGTTFSSTIWNNSNTSIAITIGTTGITYALSGGLTISTGLTLTNRTVTVATAGVTRAMLANSVAVSVIGRTANSTGVPADIAASSDGQVLKRVGSTVGFHSIGTNDINNTVVTYAKIQNVTANRILGRVTSTGAIQELALSSGLAFSGASITASGSSPAGSSGSVQFNNGGSIGADSNFFWNNTSKTLLLGGGGFYPNSTFHANGNVNTFLQQNSRNANAGGSASTDYVATADTGTQSSNYIDMGINSSTYNDSAFTISGALDGYLYTNGGNLVLGTQTSNKSIIFHTGDTLSANKRGMIDGNGKWGVGNITPNTILDINGDFATRKGIDYSSSGTFNNVPTTNTSYIRFTNNTAPTVTGFGQGADGKLLTVTYTGTGVMTISNNSGSSLSANRITTGTGNNILLSSGETVQFIYDSTASLWRLNTTGSRLLNATSSIDEASWSGNTNYTKNITVTGASLGDRVVVNISAGVTNAVISAGVNMMLNAFVSATDTVTVWVRVSGFITIPGSSTWLTTVIKS